MSVVRTNLRWTSDDERLLQIMLDKQKQFFAYQQQHEIVTKLRDLADSIENGKLKSAVSIDDRKFEIKETQKSFPSVLKSPKSYYHRITIGVVEND